MTTPNTQTADAAAVNTGLAPLLAASHDTTVVPTVPMLLDMHTLGDEILDEQDCWARYVHVLIQRDPMEKISTVCFEHCLPVLQTIHGDGALQSARVVSQFVKVSAAAEHGRMSQIYGRRTDDQTFCEAVFGASFSGRLKATLDQVYEKEGGADRTSDIGLGTHVTVNETDKNPERDGELGQHLDWKYRKLDKVSIIGELRTRGISDYTPQSTKAQLLDALAAALEAENA